MKQDLLGSSKALLELDADGALVPHGLGGHGRQCLLWCVAEVERLRSQGGAPVPSGFMLVPDPPTQNMLQSAEDAYVLHQGCTLPNAWDLFLALYSAMLSAAPQPPVSQSGVPEDVGSILTRLKRQMRVNDEYAAEARAKDDALPTVWQICNGHIRDMVAELVRSLAAPRPPEAVTGEELLSMQTAPKNGTPVLALLRNDLATIRSDLERLHGLWVVVSNRGGIDEWGLAGPFGYGGLPDEWFVGWKPIVTVFPSPPGQGDRTNDGEAGEFKPDWSLTENESAQVALSLALTRYVPGWPGATNEQLGAVASDVLAALPRKDVEGAADIGAILADDSPVADADRADVEMFDRAILQGQAKVALRDRVLEMVFSAKSCPLGSQDAINAIIPFVEKELSDALSAEHASVIEECATVALAAYTEWWSRQNAHRKKWDAWRLGGEVGEMPTITIGGPADFIAAAIRALGKQTGGAS